VDRRAWTYLRTLALAALLGFPVAAAAVLFQTAIHDVIHFVWEVVPHWLEWSEPAWWYVILVPALAGALVALFLRLPGHGGHSPLEGISTAPIRPVELPGILLAGLATLGLGLVLGPEAPLIALGLGLGAIAVRLVRVQETEAQLLVLAGAFAAVAALFGGPLVAAVMLLELVATSGAIPAAMIVRALLPGFVAAGTGALVFTGVQNWQGLHQTDLSLPSLPAYDSVRIADLAWGIVLSVAIALLVVGIRHVAHEISARGSPRPDVMLVAAGALVGMLAVVFRLVADRPVDLVLFSGQQEMPAVIAEGSASVLLLLVVAKGLAYALSLGAGFRGGPVFPALAVSVALAVLAADFLPGLDTTPAVAIGLSAATAAILRAPFTAVLLATLLLGSSAADVAPIAVFAAATGWLVAVALPNPEDRLREALDAPVGDDDAADADRDQ
jgi:H+/Cl- antiporter ClcA